MDYKHPINRKQRTLAIGIWPETSLTEARELRDRARLLIKQNIDPLEQQREERRKRKADSKLSFRLIADEWMKRQIPLSENTLLFALYRMGYHSRATTHGWRASASTILNESGLWHPDAIERQLAHAENSKIRAAYNRAEYLPERRRMMNWWADYLDSLREPAKVIDFQERRKEPLRQIIH